jgi:hypothetical protein
MKIKSKDFRVPPGKKLDLKKWPTRVKPIYKSKKNYHKLLEFQVTALSALQRLHYASNRYSVLLILQGMDVAGKDGPSGTSCPGSIRKAARSSVSNNRVPRSWSMIFCGARPAGYRNAGESEFLIVPTTRKC